MDELERRIRAANPLPTVRNAPLSARAEAELQALVATEPMRTEATPIHRRPRYARSLLGGMVAALVIGVLIVTGNVVQGPSASADGLAILEQTPIDGTIGDIIDGMIMASRANTGPGSSSKRKISFESWSANITVGEDASVDVFVQPQESERVWSDDLSGHIVSRAGSVKMGKVPKGVSEFAPGDVIFEDSFGPGEYPALFPKKPPTTGSAMRTYISDALGLTDESTAGDWFKAIQDLRTDWPLTNAQNAAVLELIKTLPGVTAGAVTDRIGREGIALQTETRVGGKFRDMLIFDSVTGLLISAEEVYLGGVDDINLPAMTVFNYTAWRATD